MPQVTLPAFNTARAITKSDTVDCEKVNDHYPVSVWVGGAGIVRAIMEDNQDIQFTCVAGTVLPVTVKRVMSSTTTATLMVGLYQQ
ncbi:MAG TPA: hypothetical protein VHL34_24830 [Rhizomicrobium sp.]|jgi:hypothetical protein|nr:hypothetical protein [Rhizomicrobium sp.]